MEFYKTIKKMTSNIPKIAVISIVAALPYLCNDGCAYSGNKVHAAEISQRTTNTAENTPATETGLETVIEK